MTSKSKTFLPIFLALFLSYFQPGLLGQDLPGNSLPGASTVNTIPEAGDTAAEPEKKKMDPVMVKELKDVVKTIIFAVS